MDAPATSTRIVIVGGGFSGLGVAIRLLERGHKDFVLLEKASQLGGTWRENTYPGCACDVPSHLYSFSYARKPNWGRVFAEQPEIQAYLLEVAEKRGVLPYVRFETEMLRAAWSDDRRRWSVATNRGDFDAQFLVSGCGPLHQPRIPALPGLENFRGTTFHSATWRHDHDLTGRRVAVIGTGSSAIQFVPKIQPKVGKLVLFQRTAPWVLPKPDHVIGAREQWAFKHIPGLQRALRGAIYGLSESIQVAERHPAAMQRLQRLGLDHLERQVRDPALRRSLTPSFTMACKRVLLSNTYYPALQADNAEVVPHAVTAVTEHGILGADGVERAVDTIIFGTGFHVTDPPVASRVFGRGGVNLREQWKKGPEAFLGTTCNGFPNGFFVIGPNTGNGHGSALTIIEAQAGYIVDAIETAARQRLASIEVRAEAQRVWNDEVQAALKTSVWNAGGCASYYLHESGRNTSIYPWTTIDLRWRLRRFDAKSYALEELPRRGRPTPIELEGAVVAVTGGARGIGLATARRFAAAGARVCIGDLDAAEARQAAAELGGHARGYPLDVSRRASFERFVADVEREVGPIAVLVNNAGIMPTGRFLDEPDDVDRAVMGVNHFGVALGMKLVLPRMIARGRGHVVNVASLAGKLQLPWMATYVASKHATVGLTGAVRTEIAGSGVTLSCVMPGVVRTRLAAGFPLEGTFSVGPETVARAIVDSVRTRAADIVVPRAMSPIAPLIGLVPKRLFRRILRVADIDRLINKADAKVRGEYERGIARHGAALGLSIERGR
jgi:cation diffusion facilitator CzcD-associated flavoprotein CzcO/NAD(P)-dependent dehydrogenase (short-subunit alcohol dehydrogenase family)